MASPDQLIISKIITDQTLTEATQAGLRPVFFVGEWADRYQWILDYSAKHGAVPTPRAWGRKYGDVDIEDTSGETFSGLFEELMANYRSRTVSAAITDAMAPLDKHDVDSAIAVLTQGLHAASVTATQLRDFNIIETWEARYAKYEEMKAHPENLLGIPTGFHGLDKITQGFRKQQFIVMVGEAKRGKSLFEMIMAMACHAYGLPPLVVSFEMSAAEQTSRFDALSARVPYDLILSGELSDAEMLRIRRSMIQRKNMHPFVITEDTTSVTTVSALAGKLMEYMPSALYVDGMYLMDDENGEPKGSPAALTNISRGLKRLAQRFDIPVIGTTQVLSWKLQNKRTRAITADAIGYTSSFAQDADLILGVERNPDFENQAIIRVVEARSAPRAQVHVLWDWQTMSFEEVDEYGVVDPSFD